MSWNLVARPRSVTGQYPDQCHNATWWVPRVGYGRYRYVDMLRRHTVDVEDVRDEIAVDARVGFAVGDTEGIKRCDINHSR